MYGRDSHIPGVIGKELNTSQWFRDTKQLQNVKTTTGDIETWFHGLISRTKAEELLKGKSAGSFLIRVSQTRCGYSLSFKGNIRCFHIAIEQRGSLYIAIGDDRASFRTLKDLITFYRRHSIVEEGYKLTEAVGQEIGPCDYLDLLDRNQLPKTSIDRTKLKRESREINDNIITAPTPSLPKRWEEPEVKPVSTKDIIKWFRQTQMSPLMKKQGGFYPWFYGLVSKSKADLMLKDKDAGCFFVRVCEDKCMLCLSMKGSRGKIKHFDIECRPNKKYNVIGELKEFKSMNNLIQYYRMYPISAFGDKLKEVGCREGHVIDFTDLLEDPESSGDEQ